MLDIAPGLRGMILYCLNAFLLALVLTMAMRKLAHRVGLVDVPTQRKNHDGRIPLVGVALFLAFVLSSLLLSHRPSGFAALLAAMTLIVGVGLADDLIDLRAELKLLAQGLSVAIMVLPGDVLVRSIGNLDHGAPLLLLGWTVPVTVFAVVGMVNALNMIDGLDGLAGGVSLMALAWFAVAAAALGEDEELLLILVLACCVLGFLIFNIRHPWQSRAAVFLGDGGSMVLGLALAFVAISLTQKHRMALPPIVAVWICALPILDTLSLIVRRLAANRNPMASDRRHLHHLLLDAGLTVNQAVLALIGVSGLLGGIGMAGWSLGATDSLLLYGLAAPAGLHVWFILYGRKHLLRPRPAFDVAKSPVMQP